MTSPIDVAYVDIVARDASLKKFERDINKAFDKVEKNIEDDLKAIDDDFDDAFDKINKHFKDMADHADRSFDEISTAVDSSFNDVDKELDKHDTRIRRRFTALGAHIKDTFAEIGQNVTRGLSNVFDKIGDVVSTVGGVLGQIGGGLGRFATSSPLLALILALIPAIIALAAALSNLIGLVGILPASLGVLIAAILPVVVAFQNFGDAVSALASGDIEKIDEALKKLSPTTANFAREVAGTLPVLREFQRAVQDAFFRQLTGGFSRLINTLLPSIRKNFSDVAIQVGTLAGQFITFATSGNALKALNDLLATTARIIDTISEPLFRFFDALATSTSAALPFVERIAVAFGNALDRFSAFINQAVESGAFNDFIEDAFTTVKELLDLVKALGKLLGTIFLGTEDAGHDFIKTLTELTLSLNEFFKSAQGQDVLRDLSFLVKALGAALGFTINTLIFFDQLTRMTFGLLEKLGAFFGEVGAKIGEFFGQVPAKIAEFGQFLSTIPTLIGQAISAAIDTAFTFIGTQIGLLLFAIQVLPGKIIDFFATLPERLGAALESTGPTLLDVFKRALDAAQAFIVTKFHEIVAFIRNVPNMLAALGPIFLNAGQNLIQSFMNGFRNVGNFIGNVAGDIVGAVKGFLNRAIDRINSGIATIDAVLPGSLARIPRLAEGALVRHTPGGILANVGEGREDEVVAPLSKLEDIIGKFFGGEGGGGMTVNFGPNSINVSFAGAVPTEGEARAVGSAVADGIAGRLATRNIRTQLRAV